MTHILSFTVEGVACALPLAEIWQVVSMMELQPGTDGHGGEAGTVNLHGRTIPVHSLRKRFGFPDRLPLTDDALIITRAGPDCVALWVDTVRGVRTGVASPAAETERSAAPGALLTDDETILIYDLPVFLEAEESVVFSRMPDTTDTDAGEPLPNPERDRMILADRARAFARQKEEPRETLFPELLTFQLAGQEYAIKMQYIREVFIIREITPVPGVPDFIAGIGAIRGEIISIVDLRTLFSIPKRGLTDLNRVIVLSDGEVTFGILADYITDIGIRPTDRLAPVYSGMTSIDRQYLLGVVDNAVIVLDAAAILADPKMVMDETRK